MTITIKQVDCTNEDFLDYYKNEHNLVLHRGLYSVDGFPFGFLAINEETNNILGAGFIVSEAMHNQLPSYSQKNNDTNPWMMALCVTERYRNQGIGKQIVDSMIEYCDQFNHTQLNLNTETASNFYKKHWQIDLVSSDLITNDKNVELMSDTIRIDVKQNLANKISPKKLKLR